MVKIAPVTVSTRRAPLRLPAGRLPNSPMSVPCRRGRVPGALSLRSDDEDWAGEPSLPATTSRPSAWRGAEAPEGRARRQGAGAGDVGPPQRRRRLGGRAVAAGDDEPSVGLAGAEGAEDEVADVDLAAGAGGDRRREREHAIGPKPGDQLAGAVE